MKQVYICEKCGKQYDNWDDAYECEHSHRLPAMVNSYDLPDDFDILPHHFNEGETVPDVITVCFPILDADGNFKEVDGINLKEVREYKLMPSRCPKRLDKFANGLYNRAVYDREQNRKWHEEWEAEQAEKKRKAEEEAQAQQEQQEDEATDSIEVTSLEVHEE